MRRALSLSISIGILVFFAAFTAAAERPAVIVSGSSTSALKVAIQSFATKGRGLGAEEAEAFYRDLEDALEFSSMFASIDPKAFLGPTRTRKLSKSLRCADWRTIGADFFIEGSMQREDNRLQLETKVWDVARCKLVLGRKYSSTAGDPGLLVKRLADEIVEQVTGKRGVTETQITFISDRPGNREVFVMGARGGGIRQATRNRSVNALPSWSPDGRSILYSSFRSGRRPALYQLTKGGKSSRRLRGELGQKTKVYRGVFDPAGETLALVMADEESQLGIFLADKHGRDLVRLTKGRGNSLSPTWSPDGKWITFVSDRTGSPQLYIMDREGKNTRRLTFTGGYSSAPAWSPDGKWIAYELRVQGQFDIWLTDPEGKVNVPIITHRRSDESPSWSPDSRKIAFSSTRRGRADIYVVDLNGENLRRITQGKGDNISPAWGPFLR